MPSSNAPTIGELFAGYGGIGLGLKSIWPDAEVRWVSDVDKGANKILAHRFPDAPNLGDITQIDWGTVEPVDIITGGSPCQDLSQAGKRLGMKKGTRSGLWASMLEGIAALRPSLVVWENVRGAYSAEADSELEPCAGCVGDGFDGPVLRALGRVLGDLADIGYDAAWVGLRAADVGACHGRFRVFILAWPADTADIGQQWRRASRDGWPGLADSGRGLVALPTPRATRGGSSTETFELLRTPMADEDGGGPLHPDVARGRGQTLRLTGQILAMTGDLLPTPEAHQSGSSAEAHLARKPGRTKVTALNIVAEQLLPTPAVNDMGKAYTPDEWDAWVAKQKAKHGNGNGHGKSLEIEAARMLSSAAARHERFGQYAPAIARWETVVGRLVPAPVEPTGKNGANRLSPKFTEWMMGLPEGWITDVPGITRNEALKACGNGVVPQQCAEAVRYLLGVRATVAAAITGEAA